MSVASKTRVVIVGAALAAAGLIAGTAWAQGIQLQAPGLEPTIKVHPAPKVEQQAPPPSAAPAAGECVCTMQYDPVCALSRAGVRTTYGNACEARCAGATEIAPGPC